MKNTNFKLNRQPKRKSKLLFLITPILIIAVGGGLLFYKNQIGSRSKNAGPGANSSNNENLATGNNTDGDIKQTVNKPKQTVEPVESASLSAKVTSLSQQNGTVDATVDINGGNKSGKCTFNFSANGSRPVTREVTSIALNSNQQCTTVIPEVEFDKLGEWNLAVLFITGDTRTTVEQKVIIK